MSRAGCQPPKTLFPKTGLPICANMTLLEKYRIEFRKVLGMYRGDLLVATDCRMPCSYMEYKVSETKDTTQDAEVWVMKTLFSLMEHS